MLIFYIAFVYDGFGLRVWRFFCGDEILTFPIPEQNANVSVPHVSLSLSISGKKRTDFNAVIGTRPPLFSGRVSSYDLQFLVFVAESLAASGGFDWPKTHLAMVQS